MDVSRTRTALGAVVSAQIPLQDGDNDPYPSCQEYCQVCPQNISEGLQIFPWILN